MFTKAHMPKVGYLDLFEHSNPCLLVENYSNQFENQTRQFAPCNTHGGHAQSQSPGFGSQENR